MNKWEDECNGLEVRKVLHEIMHRQFTQNENKLMAVLHTEEDFYHLCQNN